MIVQALVIVHLVAREQVVAMSECFIETWKIKKWVIDAYKMALHVPKLASNMNLIKTDI